MNAHVRTRATVAERKVYRFNRLYRWYHFIVGAVFLVVAVLVATLHYTLVMGAMEIGSVLLAHRLERSDSRFLRILGHSLILSGTVAHTDGTIHNVVTPGVR